MHISKTIDIDTGHRVPFHKGKCRGFHGHRYSITAVVDGELVSDPGSSDEGMVIDYSDLKAIMMEEIDTPLDHSSIYYIHDPMKDHLKLLETDSPKPFIWIDLIPTAENIAKYLFDRLEPHLSDYRIKLISVEVRETPTSSAIYEP